MARAAFRAAAPWAAALEPGKGGTEGGEKGPPVFGAVNSEHWSTSSTRGLRGPLPLPRP
jgi:hypothetical protein